MDQSDSAQDLLRCRLCDAPVPPLWCHLCNVYLCKSCAGEHMLDTSTQHEVIPVEQTMSKPFYPTCKKHLRKKCELYCKQCTNPICVQCISSQEHPGHEFMDLSEVVNRKKEKLKKSLQGLVSTTLPKYKEIASKIPNQKSYLRQTSDGLKTAIDDHGQKLHKKVDTIVNKLKSEVDQKVENQVLSLQEEEINQKISSIEEYIYNQKELQASRDLGLIIEHKSRHEEFKNVPSSHDVTLPTFCAYEINTDQLLAQFGSFSDETRSSIRPYKIAQKYGELYDNEWTDAFETLTSSGRYTEEQSIQILLECMQGGICGTRPQSVSPQAEEMLYQMIKSQKMSGVALMTMFQMTDKCKAVLKKVQQYTAKCLEVCLLMNMWDPPLAIGSSPAKRSVFDSTIYKEFWKRGNTVDFVVWLPLYMHKNGSLLHKGVVQPL
uniref:E3 ubiquitin-protein ligase TRIM36-like isoform X2 n=1 Tax=Crassostrea virginica TaxID=6565 RepID=A0A8B8AG41_CRAVI|nr:E3 ubiquitin-protein ligase TRIM36-like isoform X2 [Crassostrea virginica]